MNEAAPHVDLSGYAAAVPDEVLRVLTAGRRVLTICHENPEADALGSALAIAMLVEAGGGVATPVCADPMPAMYKFLPGMDRFRTASRTQRWTTTCSWWGTAASWSGSGPCSSRTATSSAASRSWT
jgi:hypothetical protein